MRAFIAIELSPAARAGLATVQKRLRGHLAPAGAERYLRWTSPDSVHLTLRFLGETSTEQRARLEADLRRITLTAPCFALQLGGIGCFPNLRRPAVIWAGVRGDLAALLRVQRPIEEAARLAGFAAEGRPFSPHLTLARLREATSSPDRAQVGSAVQTEMSAAWLAGWGVDLIVNEIVLMQSELRPGGTLYTPLARFPLTGE